ncbi:MAG TPA: thioesterase family protein [Vicinamibacterales bacterium]|jgi:acyl-CoA thioesterase FadM
MPFSRPVTIRFDEADARGILFYGRLHTVAHRVFEEFVVAEVVDRWDDWFLNDRYVMPIRHAESTFHQPLRPGRTYVAELEVSHLGESSFEVATRFVDRTGPEPVVCAETKVVHVFADARQFRKTPIPSEIRARLEAHLARQ